MMNMRGTNSSSAEATAREALQKLNKVLTSGSEPQDVEVVVEGTNEIIRLPRNVANLVREILANTAAGQAVSVIPVSAELTTQQAADLLNVSRPHVIKLMDEGVLKGHKVGTHRRLYASTVEDFKRKREIEQRAMMDELTALTEELGLYQ